MEEDIRKRVDKLHAKIKKLKQQKKGLQEDKSELKQKVFELESDRINFSNNNNNEDVWMNNIRNIVDKKDTNDRRRSMTSIGINDHEQSAVVKKLMKGYVDAMQKLEVTICVSIHVHTSHHDDVNKGSIYAIG